MEIADLFLRAGGIGVLAWVVHAFLKVLREVSVQCHANQDRSTNAIKELTATSNTNTAAITAALGDVNVTMARLNGKLGPR